MMSGNQSTKPFTDAYLEEGTTDSGFLSGADLMLSGEIKEDNTTPSNKQQEVEPPPGSIPHKSQGLFHQKIAQEEYMRLDSGVDLSLSENFSNLSLKNPDLNNFSKCETKPIKIQTSPVESACKTIEDMSWQVYFQQGEDGNMPLHTFIAEGNTALVLALIKMAPHPLLLDTPNDLCETPIHLAVSTGQWQIVRWLIVAGAKPLPSNKDGDSPLHIAARNGDLACCKAITNPVQQQERQNLSLRYTHPPYHHLNLDQWNYEGQTCVHVAAIYGHVDVLRHLIWFGADINAREGLSGYTPLHLSIKRGDETLQRFLLECKNLNVNTLTYGGKTVLELGCPVKSKIYELLKQRGVPSPYSSDEDDDDEDSEFESDHEMNYENTKMYVPNFVNASA